MNVQWDRDQNIASYFCRNKSCYDQNLFIWICIFTMRHLAIRGSFTRNGHNVSTYANYKMLFQFMS